jgi:hypothetical protein
MRAPLTALAFLLALPATAAAAPFGEPSLLPVDDVAGCVVATGAPGELARAAGSGVQLLQASPAGLTVGPTLATDDDDSHGCPLVAAKPGGAAVLSLSAGEVLEDAAPVRARLREPGGAWGPAVEALPGEPGTTALPPAVAVSEQGHALVASILSTSSSSGRLVVTRREPRGGFGAPQQLARATARDTFGLISAEAGMSAAGEAIVAWTAKRGETMDLWAAVARPGAPFGAPQRVADALDSARFDLAVAPDGRAMLAFASGRSPATAERAPAEGFGAPQVLTGAPESFAYDPAVALRSDGGAVVAWTGLYGGPAVAAVRDRPGAFGALVRVPGTEPSPFDLVDPLFESVFRFYISAFGLEAFDVVGGFRLEAAITGDGRALLTWGTTEVDPDDDGASPRSVTLTLSGGGLERRTHGARLRGSGSVTPVVLADGTAAVAWTDHVSGRVHLAVEGAADGADPPPPRVRLGAPVRRTLPDGEPLVLPFTCSAACDVRAEIAGSRAVGVASLSRAGGGRLRIQPLVRPIGRLRGGPVRVVVRSGAPGARHAVERTLRLTLRRQRVTPLRALGVTARRRGTSVVVRWRTNRVAPDNSLTVIALPTRADRALPVAVEEPDSGGRSFEVRLRNVADARWVVVLAADVAVASHIRRTTVRVRG